MKSDAMNAGTFPGVFFVGEPSPWARDAKARCPGRREEYLAVLKELVGTQTSTDLKRVGMPNDNLIHDGLSAGIQEEPGRESNRGRYLTAPSQSPLLLEPIDGRVSLQVFLAMRSSANWGGVAWASFTRLRISGTTALSP